MISFLKHLQSHSMQASCLLLAVFISLFLFLVWPSTALAQTSYTPQGWGGYLGNARSNYSQVEAWWFVPKITSNTPPGYAEIWIGLGGIHDNRIIRAGVRLEHYYDPTTSVEHTNYWAFVQNEQYVFTTYPNDEIHAVVNANGSIDITDETRTNTTAHRQLSVAVDTSTADFIIEKPGGPSTPATYLAAFSPFKFVACHVRWNNNNNGQVLFLEPLLSRLIIHSDSTVNAYGTISMTNLDMYGNFQVTDLILYPPYKYSTCGPWPC